MKWLSAGPLMHQARSPYIKGHRIKYHWHRSASSKHVSKSKTTKKLEKEILKSTVWEQCQLRRSLRLHQHHNICWHINLISFHTSPSQAEECSHVQPPRSQSLLGRCARTPSPCATAQARNKCWAKNKNSKTGEVDGKEGPALLIELPTQEIPGFPAATARSPRRWHFTSLR